MNDDEAISIAKKTLIVGIGYILCGDDGLGVRVIDELEKESLPENVRLHSGDVSGLDLLKVFPGHEKIIIVDASDMNETPGTIKVFTPGEIKKADFKDQFSTHGMALIETLTLAEKLGLKCEIQIVGIQPEATFFSLEMSELAKNKIPEVIETVKRLCV